MPVTKVAHDLLPNVGLPVAGPQAAAKPMAAAHGDAAHPAAVALERDLSGCVSLIGPIQICYDVNISVPSVSIALKVGGFTVVSGEISPAHPCLTLKGDYGVAKWDLNLCLRGTCVTLEGDACVTFVGCKSFKINIVCW